MNLNPEVRVLNGKAVRFYTPQQIDYIRNLTAPDFQRERVIRHNHALANAGVTASKGHKKVGAAFHTL